MDKKSKEFRSKYFYTPRRTELPESAIKARNEKYKKMKEISERRKAEKGNERWLTGINQDNKKISAYAEQEKIRK